MTNEEILDAKRARELVANNEKRNKLIKEFIAQTNKRIKNACKNGEREAILSYRQYSWEEPYIEVFNYFKDLGYEIKRYHDGSGYYLTW